MTDAMASAGVAAPTVSVTSAPDPAPISIWSERSAPDAAPAMSGKGRSASWVAVGANRPKQNTTTATQGMIVARRTGPPQATTRAQPAPNAMSPKQTAMTRRDGTCAVLRRALTMEPKIREAAAAIEASGRQIDLEVDGGISADTVSGAVAAGARILVAGSGLYKHEGGLADAVSTIRRRAEETLRSANVA